MCVRHKTCMTIHLNSFISQIDLLSLFCVVALLRCISFTQIHTKADLKSFCGLCLCASYGIYLCVNERLPKTDFRIKSCSQSKYSSQCTYKGVRAHEQSVQNSKRKKIIIFRKQWRLSFKTPYIFFVHNLLR